MCAYKGRTLARVCSPLLTSEKVLYLESLDWYVSVFIWQSEIIITNGDFSKRKIRTLDVNNSTHPSTLCILRFNSSMAGDICVGACRSVLQYITGNQIRPRPLGFGIGTSHASFISQLHLTKITQVQRRFLTCTRTGSNCGVMGLLS